MKPFITAGEDWCSCHVDAQKYLRGHVVPSFEHQQQQTRSLSLGFESVHDAPQGCWKHSMGTINREETTWTMRQQLQQWSMLRHVPSTVLAFFRGRGCGLVKVISFQFVELRRVYWSISVCCICLLHFSQLWSFDFPQWLRWSNRMGAWGWAQTEPPVFHGFI